MTRDRRRLSALTHHAGQVGVDVDRARRRRWRWSTAWMTSSATRTSSRSRCMTPASKREISSRSSTSCRKRSMSATIRSRAALARSGMSSRWFSSTSIDAARVISGERSSWLTLEANRASRWMRSSSATAISLNESASVRQVGVVAGLDPGVEAAAGDGLGGVADAAQRPQHPAGGPPAEGRAGQRGEQRRGQQRDADRLERVLELVERHDLEVGAVDRLERHADRQLRSSPSWSKRMRAGWPDCTMLARARPAGRPRRTRGERGTSVRRPRAARVRAGRGRQRGEHHRRVDVGVRCPRAPAAAARRCGRCW